MFSRRAALSFLVALVACGDTTGPPKLDGDSRAAVMAFAVADLAANPEAVHAFAQADLRGMARRSQSAQEQQDCTVLGIWGDVTGDDMANIVDAQQVARFSVGLEIGQPDRISYGDVITFGTINIVDAQQIARYSVGLPTESRTGQVRCE